MRHNIRLAKMGCGPDKISINLAKIKGRYLDVLNVKNHRPLLTSPIDPGITSGLGYVTNRLSSRTPSSARPVASGSPASGESMEGSLNPGMNGWYPGVTGTFERIVNLRRLKEVRGGKISPSNANGSRSIPTCRSFDVGQYEAFRLVQICQQGRPYAAGPPIRRRPR
jgi:hypothetical protein